jgi:hypothetical protein
MVVFDGCAGTAWAGFSLRIADSQLRLQCIFIWMNRRLLCRASTPEFHMQSCVRAPNWVVLFRLKGLNVVEISIADQARTGAISTNIGFRYRGTSDSAVRRCFALMKCLMLLFPVPIVKNLSQMKLFWICFHVKQTRT